MNDFQPQADFDRLIALLQPWVVQNPIVRELLTHYPEAKIIMHWSFFYNEAPNWEHILNVYQHRAKFSIEHEKGSFVIGWETMIPALEQTPHRQISISQFSTSIGSFLIFTDAEKSSFIGILKSKRALGSMDPQFEQSGIYFHQGRLSSYKQWFENGIWIPDDLNE